MLPRRLRLQRAAFTQTGKEMRAVSPHFSVSVRPGVPGTAAIISKKVEKTSVGRHRLKRRILSVALPWCGSPDAGVLIYARAGANMLPYSVVTTELTELLTRLLGTHPSVR